MSDVAEGLRKRMNQGRSAAPCIKCEKIRISSLTRGSMCEKIRTMAKKQKSDGAALSRRERQIMDIVYALEEASAADVLERIDDPPSYSTVRKLLAILVDKGHLKTKQAGTRYLYRAVRPRGRAGRSAMRRVLETFYEGSLEKAVASMLSGSEARVTTDELERLSQLIEEARQQDPTEPDSRSP